VFQQFPFGLHAQSLRDNIWVMGTVGEGSLLDFSADPIELSLISTSMGHNAANTSICDTLGNLLFYTNGAYVASADHQPMWNGYDLDIGMFLISGGGWGPNTPQFVMALPMPNSSSLYYLFYKALDVVDVGVLTSRFYYSIIDMSKNQGKGMVIEKNHLVLEGVYLDWGKITACSHANGRDWWIMLGESDSRRFYKFLLSADGLINLGEIEVDLSVRLGLGNAVYSPNGEKYVILNLLGEQLGNDLDIFDFDRCEGKLMNQQKINYNDAAYFGGVAFSPNSRFLYVSSMNYLYQFDMEASDILASKDTIGIYDGFVSPLSTNFFLAQLAPDGKIYLCAANGADVLHVINKPDEKGAACDFVQHGLQLPTQTAFSIPSFPYFNLGALPGSPCDTLGVSAVKEEGQRARVEMSPNPASEWLSVRYELGITGKVDLLLYDAGGSLVLEESLTKGSASTTIPIGHLPNGIYYCKILENEKTVHAVEKIAILR
jgi:hypothetical protein